MDAAQRELLDIENRILGQVLRRFLTDGTYRYWSLGENELTLDAKVPVSAEELDVLRDITEASSGS